MALYVSLCNWTEQGIRNVKQTTERFAAAKQAGAKQGVKVRDIYYTVGQYDFILISEASDEESFSRFLLGVGMQGNVRTVTMRAFTPDEMNKIVSQI